MGDYVLVEVGEPTVENPTAWFSRDVQWKAGTAQANGTDLRAKAVGALAANETYLAITLPVNTQVVAQVDRLTRECSGIIRLLLSQLDTTAGT